MNNPVLKTDPLFKLLDTKNISDIHAILRSLKGIEEASSRASYRFFKGELTYATYPEKQAQEIAGNYEKVISLGLRSAPVAIKKIDTKSGYSVLEANWGTPIGELRPFNNPLTTYQHEAKEQILADFKTLLGQGLVNLNGMSGTAHWHVTPDGSRIIIDNWDKITKVTNPDDTPSLDQSFFPEKKLAS